MAHHIILLFNKKSHSTRDLDNKREYSDKN